MVKIGYSGARYSDSEIMANELVRKSKFKEPEFVRFRSVADVVGAMESKDVDYGVFPFRDSVNGDIADTAVATDGKHCLLLNTAWCLMPRSVFVSSDSEIRRVYGDRETLDMCQNTIKTLFGDVECIERDEPFVDLEEGCAAVCRKEAGDALGLTDVKDDANDDSMRMVQFMIAKLV